MPPKPPAPSLEIERKFLVRVAPLALDAHPHDAIRQGYLALGTDGTEVRIRQRGARFFQTVKQGSGVQRIEAEFALTRVQFDLLWPMTEGRRVEKVRYTIPHGAYVIELDVYAGPLAGLLTAEVEFPTLEASAAFDPPAWMGRDVTGEPGYKNRSLAVYGLP